MCGHRVSTKTFALLHSILATLLPSSRDREAHLCPGAPRHSPYFHLYQQSWANQYLSGLSLLPEMQIH